MKKSQFTESQILVVLKEGEAGVPVAQIMRKHGISQATYYNWKSKYGGASVAELKRLKELEADKKPRLLVMNKVDLLSPVQRESLRDDAKTVHVSAAKGVGLTTLLDRIDEVLQEDPVSRVKVAIPQKEGKTLAMIEAKARIYSRAYKDGVVELEADAPESVVRRVREWVR